MSEQLTDFEAGKLVQSVEDINKNLVIISERLEKQEKEVFPRITKLEIFNGRLLGGIVVVTPLLGGLYMWSKLVE